MFSFSDVNEKGNIVTGESSYQTVCDKDMEPCYLSWAPLGHAMIRANSSELWKKDTLDVFLQMDTLFGKSFKSLTTPFTMFGLFDGKANVLFNDDTVKLRELPTAKNSDKMGREYEKMWKGMEECTPGSGAFSISLFSSVPYFVCLLAVLRM